MPQASRSPAPKASSQAPRCTSYGQVIEYIQDRLYLASYTHPPDENTPFPYSKSAKRSSSPSKERSRSNAQSTTPAPEESTQPLDPVYFSIDNVLLYNAFHADFGPLHMGHLYRFALFLHDMLSDPDPYKKGADAKPVAVVLWSRPDSRSRANAACILACYMVLLQDWPPHLALAPIAQMDPPCMPFRDAGYSQADYSLTIQDVIYGVWKAKEEKLCDYYKFDLHDYEMFERVDHGDFNWVSPNFVAFASPQHRPIESIPRTSPDYANLPKNTAEIMKSELPQPFKMVLAYFRHNNVGLVVRLNSELYSPSYFTALGIKHYDMIFDDGTCPPLSLVRKFIKLAHDMITVKRKQIAVHCKAGLGRTGCLIGAYLIYRHGFTANECMAYMRFMRPGMVVGPQQHWLHLNQNSFREWWYEDAMKDKMALLNRSTPPPARNRLHSNGRTFTPPNGNKRQALGELDDVNDRRVSVHGAHQDENLPAPTPGQPRKTSKAYGERHSPYADTENNVPVLPDPDTEIVTMTKHTEPSPVRAESVSESEEEIKLEMLSRPSPSLQLFPAVHRSSAQKQRAVSCMTTTTTTSLSPMRKLSGNGAGALGVLKRDSPKRPGLPLNGVRKTSGRVGSTGSAPRVKQ